MFQKSTDKNNGFNSSQDIVNEVSRVFKKDISASRVRNIRQKNGKIIKTLC